LEDYGDVELVSCIGVFSVLLGVVLWVRYGSG